MKKYIIYFFVIVILLILIMALYNIFKKQNVKVTNESEENMVQYIRITASQMVEETKNMDKSDYVILDVRTKQEYDEERIPNSVLLTLDQIDSKAEDVLPDKDIKIYVYCRSGNRSLIAAYKLIDSGYTHVYDFGGIMSYPYEKIKGTNK